MNPDPQFQEAIAQEIVWKNDEIKNFAVSLVARALTQGGHFTTDIVPDFLRGEGRGIAGSVVELLKTANVIEPVGHRDGSGQWFALRTKSTRPDRKSAWVSVYRLTNTGIAAAFLRRHGKPAAVPLQADF